MNRCREIKSELGGRFESTPPWRRQPFCSPSRTVHRPRPSASKSIAGPNRGSNERSSRGARVPVKRATASFGCETVPITVFGSRHSPSTIVGGAEGSPSLGQIIRNRPPPVSILAKGVAWPNRP